MPKVIKEILLYTLVSAIALIVDFVLLLQLAKHFHYLVAATIAFLCGCAAHYTLSIRYVFKTRRLLARKHTERVLYVAAGAAGLVVNWVIIALGIELLGAPLAVAKILASGVSFFTGYLMRKVYLFSHTPINET